jgi:hypothetical protein
MEEIPLLSRDGLDTTLGGILGWVLDTEKTSKVATATHLLVNFLRDLLGLVPVSDMRLNIVLYPFADLGAKSSMRFVEVG